MNSLSLSWLSVSTLFWIIVHVCVPIHLVILIIADSPFFSLFLPPPPPPPPPPCLSVILSVGLFGC